MSFQETWQATPIQINDQTAMLHSNQAPVVNLFPNYQPQSVNHYSLKNGLTVLHYQSHSLPTATTLTGIFIKNSDPYDPIKLKLNLAWNQIVLKDKPERASLLAANIGTKIQTVSNATSSGWYLLALENDQLKALELLSTLLKNRHYSEQELSWQKQQYSLNQQLQSVSGSSQTGKLYKRLVLSKASLVARQTENSSRRKQLNQLKLSELERYFSNHFMVENMLLVIITPSPLDDLRDPIQSLFSNLPSAPSVSQNTPLKTQLTTPKSGLYAIDRPHSTQVDIRISFTPLELQQNELASMKLFATILAGSGLNSRMQADLRENKGLSYSIYNRIEKISEFYALHFLSSAESHKAPALIQGMQQHIDYLLEHGISEDEFEQLKQQRLLTIQRQRLNLYSKMSFMIQNFIKENSLQQISSEATIIHELNYQQFKQFLLRLKQQSRLLIVAGDKNAITHHLCQQPPCDIHWYNNHLQLE